jgi:hypothetical protein
MSTIELTIDEVTKRQLQDLLTEAKLERRSEGAVIADLVRAYNGQRFRRSLAEMQRIAGPVADRLGIKTDEDVYRLLDEAA